MNTNQKQIEKKVFEIENFAKIKWNFMHFSRSESG